MAERSVLATHEPAERVQSRVTVGALIADGWAIMRRGGIATVAIAFALNLLFALLGAPMISLLFRMALRTSGLVGVDFGAMRISVGTLLSVALLLVIGVIAFALVLIQLTTVLVMLQRARDGGGFLWHDIAREVAATIRELFRPSSFPLFLYLFLMLPISGLGILSVLTQHISVPNFVSGELMKDPITAVLWTLVMLVVLWANLRFVLSLPAIVLSEARATHAMKLSWRAMKGRNLATFFVGAALVLAGAGLVAVCLAFVAVVPTQITDGLAPGASVPVAAFSAGAAQVALSILLSATTVLLLSMVLLLGIRSGVISDGPVKTPRAPHRRRHWGYGLAALAVVTAAALGISYLAPLQNLATPPVTVVLGHRGFVAGGVENTLEALEAASDAGVDRVEMDVLQTKDGRFVVIHDPHLGRLAGIDANVKDMTLEEVTSVTVRDEAGHSGSIPSLEAYVRRAAELNMPLLIEIKLGGLDTPDHVDLLVEELQTLNAISGNAFHSLDHSSVTRVKQLLPATEVGYILPFAGEGIPQTKADFLVLEEYTATEGMLQDARRAGLGFVVWTVDDGLAQRVRFREGVDAIITDRPDIALESRRDMGEETGLAGALRDLMLGFVML
ncbi:MAG: glycerophosphoryl diester phosphodiesterase membrane domain-containing protein [Leucobacter sp.]